jgi:hypothetical protein
VLNSTVVLCFGITAFWSEHTVHDALDTGGWGNRDNGGKCFFFSRIKLDTGTKIVTFAFWVGSCCFMYFWYPTKGVFSAPVQTGPGAHSASCTMGTISFPAVKSGRGVTLTPHPLLVPRSWESRAIPLLPLWAVRGLYRASVPVQGWPLPYFPLYYIRISCIPPGSAPLTKTCCFLLTPYSHNFWRCLFLHQECDISDIFQG